MVTRKAIIIGSSGGYRGLKLIKGTIIDVENYASFLMSNAGGKWRQDEIIILNDPVSNEVIKITNAADEDYVFVVFSGNGLIESYDQDDYISLKDRDISITQLVTPSKKQTIVFDVYSNNSVQYQSDTNISTHFAAILLEDGLGTRDIFDDEITKMPEGVLLIFSASTDEIAGKDETVGSYFSYSLLKSGRDWWNSDTEKTLRINEALELTKNSINEIFEKNQNPVMAGQVRRLTFPPFAFAKKGSKLFK